MTDQDHSPQSPSEPAPESGFGGLAASIGTRNLWIIILTMPAVFFVAVAVIIMVFGKPGEDTRAASPAQTPQQDAISNASNASAPISLKAGESIKSLTLDGDRIAATIEGPEGEFVVVYDIGKGAEIARIAVQRE